MTLSKSKEKLVNEEISVINSRGRREGSATDTKFEDRITEDSTLDSTMHGNAYFPLSCSQLDNLCSCLRETREKVDSNTSRIFGGTCTSALNTKVACSSIKVGHNRTSMQASTKFTVLQKEGA